MSYVTLEPQYNTNFKVQRENDCVIMRVQCSNIIMSRRGLLTYLIFMLLGIQDIPCKDKLFSTMNC